MSRDLTTGSTDRAPGSTIHSPAEASEAAPLAGTTRAALSRQREYVGLACVVLIALILRAALASLPRVIRWDEPDYIWLGKSLLTGRGYTITGVPELHYTPLLPLLSGIVFVITNNPEFATEFWYVLLGAGLCLPVYAIARHIYHRKVALTAALLVAIFPGLSSAILYWGTMTEPLFILLVYGSLWALVHASETAEAKVCLLTCALSGALLGLGYLARPEGIIWFGAFGLVLLMLSVFSRPADEVTTDDETHPDSSAPLSRLAVYVAAFVITALPYGLFLYSQSGQWMATGKLSITYDIGEAVLENDAVLYDKVTASLDETGEILWWSERRLERSILEILAEDPRAFLRRTLRNLQQLGETLFVPTLVPLFMLAPIVLGWFRRPWDQHRLAGETVLWFAILPVLAFLPFHVEARFFSAAFPVLLIWLSSGVWELGAWVVETLWHWRHASAVGGETLRPSSRDAIYPDRPAQPIAVSLLLVGLALYLGLAHYRVVTRGRRDLSYAHKEVGIWLKENTDSDSAIMTRDLALSLYAERGFVASPRAGYADYLDYARRKGADYVVVDEYELRTLRPHLSFLLDEVNPPEDLAFIYAAVDGRGRTLVYRIED